MIIKIKNDILGTSVVVDNFGLKKGVYHVDDLTISDLVRERNLLHAKLFERSEMSKEEAEETESLISQLTELIVVKCGGIVS